MICYDRIDVSERIDVNKTSKSKECNVCQYCYFLRKGFESKLYVCNRCHDLLMMCMNLTNIAVLNIKSVAYCCVISGFTKRRSKTYFKISIWQNKMEHYKTSQFIITYKNERRNFNVWIYWNWKKKLYRHKSPNFLKDVDIEKIVVLEKIYKHFIGCLHNDYNITPLHTMLPKTSAYVKSYDGQTKWMYFLIEDDDLIRKI